MESGKRGGKQTGWGGVTRDSQCIDKTKKPFNNVLIVAPRDPHGIHVAVVSRPASEGFLPQRRMLW